MRTKNQNHQQGNQGGEVSGLIFCCAVVFQMLTDGSGPTPIRACKRDAPRYRWRCVLAYPDKKVQQASYSHVTLYKVVIKHHIWLKSVADRVQARCVAYSGTLNKRPQSYNTDFLLEHVESEEYMPRRTPVGPRVWFNCSTLVKAECRRSPSSEVEIDKRVLQCDDRGLRIGWKPVTKSVWLACVWLLDLTSVEHHGFHKYVDPTVPSGYPDHRIPVVGLILDTSFLRAGCPESGIYLEGPFKFIFLSYIAMRLDIHQVPIQRVLRRGLSLKLTIGSCSFFRNGGNTLSFY